MSEVTWALDPDLWGGGRNGWASCTGVALVEFPANANRRTTNVQLTPLTSKGELLAGAGFDVPVASIPDLINALNQIYAGELGRLALNLTPDKSHAVAQAAAGLGVPVTDATLGEPDPADTRGLA